MTTWVFDKHGQNAKITRMPEAKCLTPDNCAIEHGWWRAFCDKCTAARLNKQILDGRAALTVRTTQAQRN